MPIGGHGQHRGILGHISLAGWPDLRSLPLSDQADGALQTGSGYGVAADCALASAITVIIASKLGLPVSSTHIALGAVSGVGFLREFHFTLPGIFV